MAGRSYEFEVSSELPAPAEAVWRRALTPAGVNEELLPLARMTFPREVADLARLLEGGEDAGALTGKRLFRSWVLLGGFVPVDYDDLTFVEMEPGRRFLERSPMLSQRSWEHERVVETTKTGSRISDRVRFVPRIPLLGPLYLPIFRAAFRLRHRNLRRRWRGVASS